MWLPCEFQLCNCWHGKRYCWLCLQMQTKILQGLNINCDIALLGDASIKMRCNSFFVSIDAGVSFPNTCVSLKPSILIALVLQTVIFSLLASTSCLFSLANQNWMMFALLLSGARFIDYFHCKCRQELKHCWDVGVSIRSRDGMTPRVKSSFVRWLLRQMHDSWLAVELALANYLTLVTQQYTCSGGNGTFTNWSFVLCFMQKYWCPNFLVAVSLGQACDV